MFQEITDPAIIEELSTYGNLTRTHLDNMDISSVNTNLEGIRFNNSYLRRSNLINVNMFEARLIGTHLEGAYLENAILTRAIIDGAHFEGAHLRDSFFDGIRNFNDTHFEGAHCHNINLDESTIEGAHFQGAILTGANFNNVTFGLSFFTGANFSNTTFNNCRFVNTYFSEANFTGAQFIDCECDIPNFIGANFTDAQFISSNFTDAMMDDAIFEGVTTEDTFFNLAELSPEQRAHLEMVLTPEVVPPIVHGVAFEIHNFFAMLNLEGIGAFLDDYNRTHEEVNPNTLSDEEDEHRHLFSPLLTFIDNSNLFLPEEKERCKNNLEMRILPRVYGYEDIDRFGILFNSVMNFVCRQNDDFIEQYIRIYTKDCISAYTGAHTESCTKGLIERIVTTLNIVASNFLLDFPDNHLYREVQQLFPTIVFNDVVQEWAGRYLEGGEFENELTGLTVLQRKQHFIDYMRDKYGGLLTESIENQIMREADEYFAAGVFERMAFGLKRRKFKKSNRFRKPKKRITKKLAKRKQTKKKLVKRKRNTRK